MTPSSTICKRYYSVQGLCKQLFFCSDAWFGLNQMYGFLWGGGPSAERHPEIKHFIWRHL